MFKNIYYIIDVISEFFKNTFTNKEKEKHQELINELLCKFLTSKNDDELRDNANHMIEYAKKSGKYNRCTYGDVLVKLKDYSPNTAQKVAIILIENFNNSNKEFDKWYKKTAKNDTKKW